MQDHSIIELARELRLSGLATELEMQIAQSTYSDMGFSERIGKLLLAEKEKRYNTKLARILKEARLKVSATPEEFYYSISRGIKTSEMREILACKWIHKGWNILISGEAGVGKTWIACCIATAVARTGLGVRYFRVDDLLYEIALARANGTLLKLTAKLQKYELLILDDFGITPMKQQAKSDLLAVIDGRGQSCSTVFIGQRPYNDWHGFIGDPLIADAILDRLSKNKYHIKLSGNSLRGKKASFDELG